MRDDEVIAQIHALVEEEHRLERAMVGRGKDEAAGQRVRELEVALDQCWDLLRQRRARRSAGQDPDDAELRPATIVEGYSQ